MAKTTTPALPPELASLKRGARVVLRGRSEPYIFDGVVEMRIITKDEPDQYTVRWPDKDDVTHHPRTELLWTEDPDPDAAKIAKARKKQST